MEGDALPDPEREAESVNDILREPVLLPVRDLEGDIVGGERELDKDTVGDRESPLLVEVEDNDTEAEPVTVTDPEPRDGEVLPEGEGVRDRDIVEVTVEVDFGVGVSVFDTEGDAVRETPEALEVAERESEKVAVPDEDFDPREVEGVLLIDKLAVPVNDILPEPLREDENVIDRDLLLLEDPELEGETDAEPLPEEVPDQELERDTDGELVAEPVPEGEPDLLNDSDTDCDWDEVTEVETDGDKDSLAVLSEYDDVRDVVLLLLRLGEKERDPDTSVQLLEPDKDSVIVPVADLEALLTVSESDSDRESVTEPVEVED